MKKTRLGLHPTPGASENFKKKRWQKPWESRKGKRAQETQWLGGMPKSQERVITKIKWVCPSTTMKRQIKEERWKKRWTTQKVKLLIVILSLWNPETPLSLMIFSFITKNLSLHYMPVEVISNRASKQRGLINNALKMQGVLLF